MAARSRCWISDRESARSGSVYTIDTDVADRRLALFLIQTQTNRGSGRIIPGAAGTMKEAIKTPDAFFPRVRPRSTLDPLAYEPAEQSRLC
jgi:hypothetical protein